MVQRWGILRSAMPRNISIAKIVSLVNVLAKLHNFCIDQTNNSNSREIPQMLLRDCHRMMNRRSGYVVLSNDNPLHNTAVPEELLHSGEHFRDVPNGFIRDHRRRNPQQQLPRTQLHQVITEGHWERPSRMNSSAQQR